MLCFSVQVHRASPLSLSLQPSLVKKPGGTRHGGAGLKFQPFGRPRQRIANLGNLVTLSQNQNTKGP